MKITPISRFIVNGNSMTPTLRAGQDVLSFNWAYLSKKPRVGDIVVVKVNAKDMVKRVDKVYDRTVYLLGDNNNESSDSRDFGPVKTDQIVGKVVYKSEIRSTKSETNSNNQNINDKNILNFEHSNFDIVSKFDIRNSNFIPCPQCGFQVIGIYGRKDAICKNCGFKLSCCGEP